MWGYQTSEPAEAVPWQQQRKHICNILQGASTTHHTILLGVDGVLKGIIYNTYMMASLLARDSQLGAGSWFSVSKEACLKAQCALYQPRCKTCPYQPHTTLKNADSERKYFRHGFKKDVVLYSVFCNTHPFRWYQLSSKIKACNRPDPHQHFTFSLVDSSEFLYSIKLPSFCHCGII